MFKRTEIRYGYGIVQYDLTTIEVLQIIKANILAFLTGKCPADYMGMELENLLCGFDGVRHQILQHIKNEELDKIGDSKQYITHFLLSHNYN